MKKENRKIAQEKRALERKKQEQKRKLKKALPIALVALIAIACFSFIIATSNSSSSEKDVANNQTGTESSGNLLSEETGPDYSTDTSLTVKDGDTVNIDYVGSIDGVEFEGGSTNNSGTDLTIGSHTYIDNFEEQLIGHHPGDHVDVTVTFPEDYGQESLNGKEALFKVTINGIYQ